ncbi:PPE family protein [Mycolicibacter icosiumassiliensis]|uniref:PPE family protein n=1 Tax=Mycolicibacter icosiumassiliensis TaxID=1792835 RepID=UPI000B08F386|nr:PPE family protein [Mycolicibacter icosiumassiliensis]
MLEFGILPPEITSVRIYSGPGSESMIVAAGIWDVLAAQLDLFVRGYSSIIAALEGESWSGPAATAMVTATAPYLQWATTTGIKAEQTASQARAAAAAFEAAYAAVVPPAAVAANRSQLLHLIATNILGQNANQIAATEADYAEMWAQDTRAMDCYAASASSATQLSPFTESPQMTNLAGQSATAASSAASSVAPHLQALSQLLSTVPQQLAAATAPSSGAAAPAGIPIPESWITFLDDINYTTGIPDIWGLEVMRDVGAVGSAILNTTGYLTDGGGFVQAGATEKTSPTATPGILAGEAESSVGRAVGRSVLVSVGEATAVGQLSAPPAWANATPIGGATDTSLASWGAKAVWEETPKMGTAGTGLAAPMAAGAGGAAARKVVRPSVSAILQVMPPRYQVPRHTAGG